MGLMIHSLDILSPNANRDYYIYLLDYGWEEPLAETLRKNFRKMAEWASKNDAAVITGVGDIGHFDNQVLSWHHINGEEAGDLLPAILITKMNPHQFRVMNLEDRLSKDFAFVLIPLKRVCKTETDVVEVIKSISRDVETKKDLSKFQIHKELNPGIGKAIVRSVILQPSLGGVGFSFNKLIAFLKRR